MEAGKPVRRPSELCRQEMMEDQGGLTRGGRTWRDEVYPGGRTDRIWD